MTYCQRTWRTSNYPAGIFRHWFACPGAGASPIVSTEANSFYALAEAGVFPAENNCFRHSIIFSGFHALVGLEQLSIWCVFTLSMWKYNGVFYPDSSGNYQVYPVGYGIKAFDLGGHGIMLPIEMTNSSVVNLTAYAVEDATNLYVTIINREHGAAARSATVTILPHNYQSANVALAMFLTAPNNDPSTTSGITLERCFHYQCRLVWCRGSGRF